MIELQIRNSIKYGQALQMLYRMGGMFRTRPFHKLIVGPAQRQARAVRARLYYSDHQRQQTPRRHVVNRGAGQRDHSHPGFVNPPIGQNPRKDRKRGH